MSKHRVSYRLDMIWAFNITIKVYVCLFFPQVGPHKVNMHKKTKRQLAASDEKSRLVVFIQLCFLNI